MINYELLKQFDISHVCIYLRKSRAEEGLDDLEKHRSMLVEICERYKLTYEIKAEIASSNTIEYRHVFVQVLEDARKGIFDAIMVVDLDRLSRNIADFQQIKQMLAMNEIKVITPNDVIDFNNANQDIMTDMQGLLASAEYKMIKKRLRDGKIQGAKKGFWVNGTAPLGYDYNRNTKKLVINEVEAKIIKHIYSEYLKGSSILTLMVDLNQAGYRSKNGELFSTTHVSRILNNEVYLGTVAYGKTRGSGHKNKPTRPLKIYDRHDWMVVVENAHPAIITEEEFEAVQEKLKNTKRIPQKAKKETFSLSGLVKCAICGAGTSFNTKKNAEGIQYVMLKPCWRKDKVTGQKCGNKGMKIEKIEQVILDFLKQFRDQFISMIKDDSYENNENDLINFSIEKKEKELEKFKVALEKVHEAFETGQYDAVEFVERKKKNKEEIKRLVAEIANLKSQQGKKKPNTINKKIRALDLLLDNYQGAALDSEKNRLLKEVVEKITIKRTSDHEEPEVTVYLLEQEAFDLLKLSRLRKGAVS